MARPERNTVDYFPHICGEGKKMFFIEKKYGNDGYATWFKLLEKIALTELHYLDLSVESEVLYLAAKCNVDENLLLEIISDLAKVGAINKFLWENKVIWSDKFIENIQDAYERRKNKCITYEGLCNHLLSKGVLKPSKRTTKVDINTHTILYNTIQEDTILENTNIDFDVFWKLYPIKAGKKKAEDKWKKLKFEEQQKIIDTLPSFVKYKPFESYSHPHALTYLNGRRWEDEIQVTKTETGMVEKTLYLSGNTWNYKGSLAEFTQAKSRGWKEYSEL